MSKRSEEKSLKESASLFVFQVWKAEAESICGLEGGVLVAVKTAKEDAPQKEVRNRLLWNLDPECALDSRARIVLPRQVGDLLQEMRIMQQIGPHPNVVAMLGVCVEQGKEQKRRRQDDCGLMHCCVLEPYLLIMEYVMKGKLLQHLRDQRSKQTNFFQFSEADAAADDGGGGKSAKQ